MSQGSASAVPVRCNFLTRQTETLPNMLAINKIISVSYDMCAIYVRTSVAFRCRKTANAEQLVECSSTGCVLRSGPTAFGVALRQSKLGRQWWRSSCPPMTPTRSVHTQVSGDTDATSGQFSRAVPLSLAFTRLSARWTPHEEAIVAPMSAGITPLIFAN